MTVYDRIKTMSKDELQKFLYYIYLWGHINEQCGVDDECFYKHLLNFHGCHIDDIVNAMDNLSLYQVHKSFIYGSSKQYLDIKFFTVEDAVNYIMRYEHNLHRVDDMTYVTEYNVYRIIPVVRGGDTNVECHAISD